MANTDLINLQLVQDGDDVILNNGVADDSITPNVDNGLRSDNRKTLAFFGEIKYVISPSGVPSNGEITLNNDFDTATEINVFKTDSHGKVLNEALNLIGSGSVILLGDYEGNYGSWAVTGKTDNTTYFTYTVSANANNPSYTPQSLEGIMTFYGGAGGGGESNTASNVGAGDGVFKQKTGIDLEFKSLVAGSNITLTSGADSITIDSSGGGGGNIMDSNNTMTAAQTQDLDGFTQLWQDGVFGMLNNDFAPSGGKSTYNEHPVDSVEYNLGNTGATLTLDLSKGNYFRATANSNFTLQFSNVPATSDAVMTGKIFITQDATGSRVLSKGTNVVSIGGITPLLTPTANAVDTLEFTYRKNTGKLQITVSNDWQ